MDRDTENIYRRGLSPQNCLISWHNDLRQKSQKPEGGTGASKRTTGDGVRVEGEDASKTKDVVRQTMDGRSGIYKLANTEVMISAIVTDVMCVLGRFTTHVFKSNLARQ